MFKKLTAKERAAKEAAKQARFERRMQAKQLSRQNRITRTENRRNYRQSMRKVKRDIMAIKSKHAIANSVVQTAGRLGASAVAMKENNAINTALGTMIQPNGYTSDQKSLSSTYIEDQDTTATPKEPRKGEEPVLTSW